MNCVSGGMLTVLDLTVSNFWKICYYICVHVCVLDRNRRLGLSIKNKDLIPMSIVGIFSMKVRFFFFLMSVRIETKQNCDL